MSALLSSAQAAAKIESLSLLTLELLLAATHAQKVPMFSSTQTAGLDALIL
jgi:hypothetical protein